MFDTYSDYSLYEGQWVSTDTMQNVVWLKLTERLQTLDDYMATVKDFNPGGLPR